MIPPIPVNFYATVAAVQQMTSRRAKKLDGDSSSEDTAETFNAVNPSMAVQAESSAPIVHNRFKPLDFAKQNEKIEDEEEKLLRLIGNQFGLDELQGLNAKQTAAYLKVIIFANREQYNIEEIEKQFGLDFIGISLFDFLDALIDPESDAASRSHYSFEEFLHRQEEAKKMEEAKLQPKNYDDAATFSDDHIFDDDPGIYSPYK